MGYSECLVDAFCCAFDCANCVGRFNPRTLECGGNENSQLLKGNCRRIRDEFDGARISTGLAVGRPDRSKNTSDITGASSITLELVRGGERFEPGCSLLPRFGEDFMCESPVDVNAPARRHDHRKWQRGGGAEVNERFNRCTLRFELLVVAGLDIEIHPEALECPHVRVRANLMPLLAVRLDGDHLALAVRRARHVGRHARRVERGDVAGRLVD